MLTPALHRRERARLWVSSLHRLVAQAHWGKGSFSIRVSSFCSPRRMSGLEGRAHMLKCTPAYMGSHFQYIWEKSSLPCKGLPLGKEGKEVLWHWRSLFCTHKRWWNERALMLTVWFYLRRPCRKLFRFFTLPLWGLYVSTCKTICAYMYVFVPGRGLKRWKKTQISTWQEKREGVLVLLCIKSPSSFYPWPYPTEVSPSSWALPPSWSCAYPNIYLYHSSS